MSIIGNVEEIRRCARQKIEEGAVTENYGLGKEQAISVLNEALATELVCVLRYRFHYFMASGINSAGVAEEFLEIEEILAKEEEHADELADLLFALTPNSG